MKFRGLLIACVVLLALTGVLYWSGHHKASKKESAANSTPVILKVNPASVTSLTIHRSDAAPVTLAKQSSGVWKITAPRPLRADQPTVKSMLTDLSPLKAERVIEKKASNLKTFGLERPSAVIDITEKGHAKQKLLFGDNTPTGDSVYAMVAGNPRVFTTYAFHKTDLSMGLNDLRDTRLITARPEKMTRIDLTHEGRRIEFARKNGNWEIAKPGPYRADSMAVEAVADALSEARMDLTGEGSQNADAAFARGIPMDTVKVTTPSGTQTLQLREDNGAYFAKSSVAKGEYRVDPSLADSLNKTLSSFRNKAVFDFASNEPGEVDLKIASGKKGGQHAWYLKRSGNNWWLDGKKMNAGSVEKVVSSLRNLKATKFATTGFTKPEIHATVISEDGKLVEKVAIAKSGKEYFAKRASEPTLYVLNSGAVEGLLSAAKGIHPAKK